MALPGDEKILGIYLRDCRARLDPIALGLPPGRRRVPGLRREEVAQRANVSATWYTWLEQGRGGTPSTDVLDRLAHALGLTTAEREHLYFLTERRPPQVRCPAIERVSPQVQGVLAGLELCPAIVRNSIWDVLAWNNAAAKVFVDFAVLRPERRNMLHLLFTDPRMRNAYPDWESSARFIVAMFRADTARAGASKRAEKLVIELSSFSPEFKALWDANNVRMTEDGAKLFNHPEAGKLLMNHAAFAVNGQPDLTMVVFTPAGPAEAKVVAAMINSQRKRLARDAAQ